MEGNNVKMGYVEHDFNSIVPYDDITVKNYSFSDFIPKSGEAGYIILKNDDPKCYDMINALLVMSEMCAFENIDADNAKALKYANINHNIKIVQPSISYDDDHTDRVVRRSISLKLEIGSVSDLRSIIRARRLFKDFINLSDGTEYLSTNIKHTRNNVITAINQMSKKYNFVLGTGNIDFDYKNHISAQYEYARMTIINSINFLFNILYNIGVGYRNGIYPMPASNPGCSHTVHYRISDKMRGGTAESIHIIFDLEITDNKAYIGIMSKSAKIIHYTKLHSMDELHKPISNE